MGVNVRAEETGLIKGAVWSVAGAGFSRALLLLASVAIGRILGVLEFGKFGMLQSTVGLFGALAGATLGVTATRFVAHYRGRDQAQAGSLLVKAYRFGLASGAVGTLIAAGVSPLLGARLLNAPELVPLLRLAALLVFFGAVNGVQTGILAGLGAFPSLAVASTVRGVLTLAGMAWGALSHGLWGALAGQLAAELFSAAVFHFAIVGSARAQQISLVAAPTSEDFRALSGFALPTLLATFALQPVLWFGSVLVANTPNGFTELGLFTAAERWRQILLFLPASLSANVLSTLSRLEGEGNHELYRRVFRRSLGLILLAVIVPGAAVAALAPTCLSVFGNAYRSGAATLVILVASCIPVALNTSLGQLLQTRGLAWWRFAVDVVMAVLLLFAALTYVPSRGASGYALAHLVAYGGAVMVLAVVLLSLRREARSEKPLLIHLTTIPETLRFLRGQPEYMRTAGFEVGVISSPGDQLRAFAREQQVRSWAVPMQRRIAPLSDLISLVRLSALLLKLRPTVIHAHTPKAGLLGMLAGAIARIPVRIYHLHGLPLETARGLKRQLLRGTELIACALAHRVLAVSRSLREVAVSLGMVAETKIGVPANGSANGVDAHREFNPELHRASAERVREQLRIPPKAPVVGFVGRIVRDKGVVELCACWQLLREQYPDARLVLIGPVEQADAVPKATLDVLRGDPRVHLLGPIWDVAPYMAAMDVLVLPTHREGFGYVLLEAGALGLPTVATRTTGCVDAVLDGRTGSLVAPRDRKALGEAISHYLRSPELRRAHGAAGRARALGQFDRTTVWDALLSEYRSALAELPRKEVLAPGPRLLPTPLTHGSR